MNLSPFATIAETLQAYQSKKLSPVEMVKAHLDHIQTLQPNLNAFVHLDAESALARARNTEAAFAPESGSIDRLLTQPLAGIPLTVKSCIDVAGWPCPAGSLLRKDYVPNADAPLIQRLEAAGAIFLGNTNTPEFLMAYETDNRVSGKTSNPWNLTYSAGGSSGGEAAAIASGCSMGGIGSDGGGSIRTPAHFCGICGLKPTPGRVPITGHFPPGGGAFGWIGVVGPMARTVGDVRAIFRVIEGPDPGDALSAPVAWREFAPADLRGMRIGILENPELGRATPETLSAIRRAAQMLCDLGYRVEPIKLDKLQRALELWWYFFGPVIASMIQKSTAGKEALLSPILRDYLALATAEPLGDRNTLLAACAERDAVRASLLRQLQDIPVVLSPVSTEPACRHLEGYKRAGETMRFCQWLNLAGFPGFSLPFGRSDEGLPINVQLTGRPHEEDLLLAVAETLETARGPWQGPRQEA